MIAPTVLPSGKLHPSSIVVDPDKDSVYPLWWVITYRDGTERRQYEVRGDNLIQTRFGLLPRTHVSCIEVNNGPPWDCVLARRILLPIGAEAEIHLDGGIVLSADVEIARKTTKSGRIVMPGAQNRTYRIERNMCYTYGWHMPEGGPGYYTHFATAGSEAKMWTDSVCYV